MHCSMATGLYWCLVLTECLSLIACGKCTIYIIYSLSTALSDTVVSFSQTPYPIVCPGDTLVYTCVVTGSSEGIVWRRNNVPVILKYSQPMKMFPDFELNITFYNNITTELVSTATRESAPIQLDGSIGCSTDAINYMTLTINIAGKIQYNRQ